MTDKEIIKALECCSKDDCDNCPYKRNCKNVMYDVLDLITRQQAEIERLQKKVEELSEVLSESIRIRYKEAKSEAVKEFAEKLKEKVYSVYSIRDLHITIDNLVKEMVGES